LTIHAIDSVATTCRSLKASSGVTVRSRSSMKCRRRRASAVSTSNTASRGGGGGVAAIVVGLSVSEASFQVPLTMMPKTTENRRMRTTLKLVTLLVACAVGCKQRQPPTLPPHVETPQEYWNDPATISRLDWLRINLETDPYNGNCPQDEIMGPNMRPCVSYSYVFDEETGSVEVHLDVYNDAPASSLELYKKRATSNVIWKARALYGYKHEVPISVKVNYYNLRKKSP
jgi:hypothetical protein